MLVFPTSSVTSFNFLKSTFHFFLSKIHFNTGQLVQHLRSVAGLAEELGFSSKQSHNSYIMLTISCNYSSRGLFTCSASAGSELPEYTGRKIHKYSHVSSLGQNTKALRASYKTIPKPCDRFLYCANAFMFGLREHHQDSRLANIPKEI